MNQKLIYLFIIFFISLASLDSKALILENPYNQAPYINDSDTLRVAYTYWWPQAGPFIGLCGDQYAVAFLGTVTKIGRVANDKNQTHPTQHGTINIDEILFTNQLAKQQYSNQNFFTSTCFFNSKLQPGDQVIVFCYEYEGRYAVPGPGAILKIQDTSDPALLSIKKYIAANQNPLAIKDDLQLWENRGHGQALSQIIDCALNQGK